MPRSPRPENAHQLQAYQAFRSQPQPRNIRRLARETNVPWRTLFEWQRRYQWRERALAHDRKLIDAAAAEREEERATRGIVRNFHQSLKLTMADYATSVQRRHEKGEPVRENEVLVALKCLGILYKDYADILSEPEPA